jgi:choline dehydrogenase
MTDEGDCDCIITGAGTAGCVPANRLTAGGKTRVLLLKAGGSDRYHWAQNPVGYLCCIGNPRTDWMMKTAAEPGLNRRRLSYPRGKVLGGCSSVNGMIYMPGLAADYDHWRQPGNPGWGWDDVLPCFRRSGDHCDGEGPMHGAGGEWRVERQRLSWESLRAVQEGAKEFGILPRQDFNDGTNGGPGFFQGNQSRGLCWNTARGFLRPAMRRGNLRVVTHALVQRLISDGCRATGVEWLADNAPFRAGARAGIILPAGAINSPKLLALSGIGQPDRVASPGIPVALDLPGVGENLQDHLQTRTVFKGRGTSTLNDMAGSLFGKARIVLQYALARSGPMSMAPSQFGMFTRSGPDRGTPDLVYHVQPLSTDRLGNPPHPFPAITVSVCNLRPTSVGSVHATTARPGVQPEIRLNCLSTDEDRRIAVASVRQARRIMTARALRPYAPEEWLPDPGFETDAEPAAKAGDIATTIFHPVGTCRMGNGKDAVVDPDLKVKGMSGLRIVDASIMPGIVSGNTASPVIMIAERAAEMIPGRD